MVWPVGQRVPDFWKVVKDANPPPGKIVIEVEDPRNVKLAWSKALEAAA